MLFGFHRCPGGVVVLGLDGHRSGSKIRSLVGEQYQSPLGGRRHPSLSLILFLDPSQEGDGRTQTCPKFGQGSKNLGKNRQDARTTRSSLVSVAFGELCVCRSFLHSSDRTMVWYYLVLLSQERSLTKCLQADRHAACFCFNRGRRWSSCLSSLEVRYPKFLSARRKERCLAWCDDHIHQDGRSMRLLSTYLPTTRHLWRILPQIAASTSSVSKK